MNGVELALRAFESLAGRKLRSLLTMLGMVFGVAAVISMLAIGSGAEREAQAMIERLGLRNVLVRARALEAGRLEEARKKSLGVSFRDAEAILDGVPGVELAAPRIDIEPWLILAGGHRAQGEVFGVGQAYPELTPLELAEGRFLDALDERTHAQVCVIGAGLRRDLFGHETAIAKVLKVNDVWLEVVGVLAPPADAGESFEGVHIGSIARHLYLPVTTAARKFERDPLAAPLAEIVVGLAPGTGPRATAGVLQGLLERLHAGVDDFEIVVPEALLRQAQRTRRLFSMVMGSIAGISLLVGGIGIMNIMLASVLERTREIGVRRAVGARRRDIVVQFVTEAFVISGLGGIAGVLVGLLISWTVAAVTGWTVLVSPASVLLAVAVSMAVGLASGIYPARRAAYLDPIEALRYE